MAGTAGEPDEEEFADDEAEAPVAVGAAPADTGGGGGGGGGDVEEEDELLAKLLDDTAYDTDLEDPPRERPDIVELRRRVYLRKCAQLGVAPVSRYVRKPAERKLRLSYRCLSAKETDAITFSLEMSPDVVDLNLRDNRLEQGGFEFVNCLLKDSVYLNKVNISGNRLGREGMSQLKRALLRNNSVSTLDASGNEFDEHTGQDWKEILLSNDRLTQLNLAHNQLGCVGAAKLAEAIGVNDTLCNLNLNWNCIRLKGALLLAKSLRINKALRELHLQFNGFSNEGAVATAAALSVNQSLRVLDLSGNRIFRRAAAQFARLFRTNRKLRVLRLRTNPLLSDGVLEILKVLNSEEEIGLQLLDVEDITVAQDLIALYKEVRSKNPKFRLGVRTVIRRDGTVERHQDDLNIQNPLEVLLMFMQEKNLRLIDLFKNLDKDQSNAISRDEFVLGLRDFEVPVTEDQIDQLIETLDKDGDGEVDLGEILNINKEFRDVKRRAIHRVRQRRATVRIRDTAHLAARAVARLQSIAATSSSFTEEHHSCSSDSEPGAPGDESAAAGRSPMRTPQQQHQQQQPQLQPPPSSMRRRFSALRRPSTAVAGHRVLPNIWSGKNYNMGKQQQLREPQQQQQQQQQRMQIKPGSTTTTSSISRLRRPSTAVTFSGVPSADTTSAANGSSSIKQRKWLPNDMAVGKPQSKR